MRTIDPRRMAFITKFDLRYTVRLGRMLSTKMMDQLDACADDEARRLLLGVSHVSQA